MASSAEARYDKLIQLINNFAYPTILLVLLICSAVPAVRAGLGFDLALVPLAIVGAHLLYSTFQATVHTKKITAGVLVVVAMAATIYIENYLAAAIVGWMMIIGEAIEALTLEKTRNAVRELIKLAPSNATVLRDGKWVHIPLSSVQKADVVLVKPGERVPVDGVVTLGPAAIDQSSITGESMPVDKTAGSKVYAGSFCVSGAIELTVEKIGDDTTLGQIIRVVKQAQENKGQAQKFADKFAGYFTPAVLLLSVLVFFGTGHLVRAITILVIACPCALVLATPTAVVASVGNAAKRGVLIKGGLTLEQAGRVTAVLFDKTGTLTKGTPSVVAVYTFQGFTEEDVMVLAGSVEQKSEHPISKAILNKTQDLGLTLQPVKEFVMDVGKGVKGTVNEQAVWVGNQRILSGVALSGEVSEAVQAEEQRGRTALLVSLNEEVVGCIAVADTIRPSAARAVQLLRESGIKTILMLTGDNQSTAAAIAAEIGISDFRAGLFPQEKLDVVQHLRSQGETVAMIGDGVNDGPALALADIGIAMGAAGTDVAIEAADIALMGDELLMVPDVLSLSKAAVKIIQQNIWVFAVGVNVIGMVFSTMGQLTPISAAIVHNVASIAVVANSARLLTVRGVSSRDVTSLGEVTTREGEGNRAQVSF